MGVGCRAGVRLGWSFGSMAAVGVEPEQRNGGCWFVVLVWLSWMKIGVIDDVAV